MTTERRLKWEALSPKERDTIRFVVITHYDDGVGVFGPELTIRAPEWLRGSTRHTSVPKGMRWMPTTTFFQVLCDMKNAAQVVPGVFEAKGHDYRADLLPFFQATLGLKATPEQLASIEEHLVFRELLRSKWLERHKTADASLSAIVLARILRQERELGTDTDARLLQLVREVIADEAGAEGGAETKVDASG